MEAELLSLQKEQDELDRLDAQGNPAILECFRSWAKLKASGDERMARRRELIIRVKAAVKEYYEALLLQQNILNMGPPRTKTINAVKSWMDGSSDGRPPAFLEPSASRLNDKNDLLALVPEASNDPLSRLADIPYLRYFCLDSRLDDKIAFYSQRKVNRFVEVISMGIAVALLIASIVALYVVQSNNMRLGLVCMFTIMFGLSIHMLTNARQAELFASTAAYAAVLVVFPGANLFIWRKLLTGPGVGYELRAPIERNTNVEVEHREDESLRTPPTPTTNSLDTSGIVSRANSTTVEKTI